MRKLRDARVTRGLRVEDAAKRVGVTKDTLWRWERGTTTPDATYLMKLSSLYECDPAYLMSESAMIR